MTNLSRQDISKILKLATEFKKQNKVPKTLKRKTIANLFFEPSTRTQVSFETAAKRLGGNVLNFNVTQSSALKGETLIDTAKIIEAMNADIIVIRHPSAGAPHLLTRFLKIPIINAGDGCHEHPTQALLDMMTIQEHKGDFKGLNVLIVGDIAHSRVARSNIYGLKKMGATVHLCAPPTLLPSSIKTWGIKIFYTLAEAVKDADVIMMLRIQRERQSNALFPSYPEYIKYFSLNANVLGHVKKESIIMHPGPVNRGVEMMPEVIDDPRSVILNQVSNGVVIRMAALHLLGDGGTDESSH